MSKVEMLRAFVNQRLTAAADEIFELFERTIAEYEEELEFSSRENHRQRKLLDAVLHPEVRLHRAGNTDDQQLLVVNEEVPPEQHEWSPSLDQEDTEPPHIKEEQEEVWTSQEELWTSQEREQLQWLEEADIKFPFTSVPVKSEEDDEEKAQSSQLHESQSEENRVTERTEAEGDDCAGPEPARNSDPDTPLEPAAHDKTSHYSEPETDDSRDWEETQSVLHPLQNNEVPVSDLECNTGKTSVSSSECAGSFGHGGHLQKHTVVQTGVKPFRCSVCNKRFTQKGHLRRHFRVHTGEKPFSCKICSTRFADHSTLRRHLPVHTGEKPFSCSVCSKTFSRHSTMRRHLSVHTGEKPFFCSVCSKTFTQKAHLRQHLRVHTGEKPFICSVCSERFADHSSLRRHLTVHTGEKPFSCSFCGKTFSRHGTLRRHLTVHRGEKPPVFVMNDSVGSVLSKNTSVLVRAAEINEAAEMLV
ncbi:zinc finger protein 184-like isoform X1 [Sebastes umbrosus]|uniref:zinc finger protein 184-like isoform X1 n=1 Tax=Sebastes umbrosus TaxID=72105 RepID=UPI00189DD94C|nr:zinc finger protein 184-like isoform X1 [Sebastes umbrosus]